MENNKKLGYLILLAVVLLVLCCLYVFLVHSPESSVEKKVKNENLTNNYNNKQPSQEQVYIFDEKKFNAANEGLLKMKENKNLGESTKNLIEIFESNLPKEDKAAFWYLSYGYNFVKLISKLDNSKIKPYCDALFKTIKNSQIYIINPAGKYEVNQIIKINKPKEFFEKVLKDLKNSNINKSNPYIIAIEKCLSVY